MVVFSFTNPSFSCYILLCTRSKFLYLNALTVISQYRIQMSFKFEFSFPLRGLLFYIKSLYKNLRILICPYCRLCNSF